MRYFNFLEFLSFFFRPITVCCDIIYDKPNNESNKTECIQYKPGIAIKGTIQGRYRERHYQELGLHSVPDRCKLQKLTFL